MTFRHLLITAISFSSILAFGGVKEDFEESAFKVLKKKSGNEYQVQLSTDEKIIIRADGSFLIHVRDPALQDLPVEEKERIYFQVDNKIAFDTVNLKCSGMICVGR